MPEYTSVDTIKISAVSYTNSKPFIYGIQNNPIQHKIDLSLDIPADCAQKLIENKVDIGLIPVAAIADLPEWHIVTNYCISATGAVNSVFIFSNCPIEKVKTIQLDPQSRTSNNLARVLFKHYWKIQPDWMIDAPDYAESTDEYTGFVQIGDRTFGKTKKYKYVYDLSEMWRVFTGLPFVFAAWVANKPISAKFIDEFNAALKFGVDNREFLFNSIPKADIDLKDYLLNKIEFELTATKKEALELFLGYISDI